MCRARGETWRFSTPKGSAAYSALANGGVYRAPTRDELNWADRHAAGSCPAHPDSRRMGTLRVSTPDTLSLPSVEVYRSTVPAWVRFIFLSLLTGCGSVVVPPDATPVAVDIVVTGPGTVNFLDRVCPTNCSASVMPATEVVLDARPTGDAEVLSWSVDGCGTALTCTVRVDVATTVDVQFVWPQRTLAASASGPGSVMGSVGIDCGDTCTSTFDHGSTVVLMAVPDRDAMFGVWGADCAGSNDGTCSLVMDRNRSATASFDAREYAVTVQHIGTGAANGRVTSNVGNIDCPGTCSTSAEAGTVITFTAMASNEARFDGWVGANCPGATTCTLTVAGATELSAIFTDLTLPINVQTDGSGDGTVTSTPLGISCGNQCVARFVGGSSVTLIATPSPASRFQGWSDDCLSSGRSANCLLTLESARNARATFHDNRVVEVAFGLDHTCALLDPGFVRCFGDSADGQLGYGDIVSRGDGVGPPANTNDIALEDVTTIGAGHWHTCAIVDGSIYCWGRNIYGQLGMGGMGPGANPTPLGPLDLGAGIRATSVQGGAFHTCAIADGAVRCWGLGSDGALGYGDGADRATPGPAVPLVGNGTVLQVVTGGRHTCVLKAPGVVRCWGDNTSGQLGYGDNTRRGATPGTIGDVDLGGALAVEIGVGGAHTCARLTDGTVRCWGRNVEGQLGLGDITSRADLPGDLPITEAVPLPAAATDLAVGNSHTCARVADGRVFCWGWAFYGQLGSDDTVNRGDGVGPAPSAAPVNLGISAVNIFAGATNHNCATSSSGAIRCWGVGTNGQLGHGARENRGDGTGPSAGNATVPVF